MIYRSDVDGLRAVAVVFVLLFHAGFGVFSGGFIGVDIFFVISGFVITAKLVDEIDSDRFSFLDFYLKRIRRLMPAMIVTVFLVCCIAWFLFLPPQIYDLAQSILATIGFSANFYFWKNSGYFEIGAQTRPLLHMWSLAVEEQFYFFIPLALFVTKRYVPRLVKPLFLAVALASLTLSIYLIDKAPTADFFLLPTRAWELILGSLIVLIPLPVARTQGVREALGALAIGMIAFPAIFYDEATPFPGIAALVPTIGAALAIYIGGSGSAVLTRTLSLRIFVWVGTISYSLYLVHWPIIVFIRTWQLRDPNAAEAFGIVLISVLLGWLSWRFVEMPFRSGGKFYSPRTIFACVGIAMASLAALSVVGLWTNGGRSSFPDFSEDTVEHVAKSTWMEGRCFLINQKASDWAGAECVRTNVGTENLLLWGDSFAAHYVTGLLENAKGSKFNVVQYTFAGCPPVLGYRSFARPGCEPFNERIFEIIKDYQIKTVVIAARWDQLRQRGLSLLTDTINRLEGTGVKIVVVGQSPMFAFDAEILRYRHAGDLGSGRASWFVTFDRTLNDRVRMASTAATFINPLSAFCRAERCEYLRDGKLLFGDYGHFSARGSNIAVRNYFPGFAHAGPVVVDD